MLVLARRIGQEIVIAGNIRVTVLGVKGNQVRLGITAPSSVHVVRQELLGECPEDAGTTRTGCPALQSCHGAVMPRQTWFPLTERLLVALRAAFKEEVESCWCLNGESAKRG